MNRRSKTAAVFRSLLALTVLAGLLAAVPYLLLRVGVLPHHMPSWEEVSTSLTSPDDGQLFLGALTLIGWYGWGTFVISVALEAVSALRDRKAPRIKLLGGSQQLAGALIGGILLLLPTGTAFATPATTTTPISAPSQPESTATSAVSTPSSAAAAKQYAGPVHHVQEGDSLWEIAEKRLGSGLRWHEIVKANKDITQADGTHLTEDTTILQPGWTLRLPADATAKPSAAHSEEGGPRAQTDRTTAQDTTHTVLPGETLSSIAKNKLGNADDYPKIAELNDDIRQPDGRTLTDPDEIHPGWQLKIPAAHADSGQSDHDSTTPPLEEQPAPAQDRDGGEQQGGASQQDQTPEQGNQQDQQAEQDGSPAGGQETTAPHESATPAQQPKQTPSPRESAEQPSADRPAADATADAAPQPASDGSDQNVRTVAAAGSILAAAVLAVVATRRARQQRRRRAKRRIPMPAGATADFEKHLRVASDITGTALADRALRTLAANCRTSGRPLPEVEAMRITARGVELHLAAATPPIAPFTERDDSPVVWWCPARSGALLDQEEAADIVAPYPALVSLGETEDGDPVLVDLETIGLLRLDGSPADVRAVLLALAVELASSKLADATQIVLAGAGSELQSLYPDQIDHHTDLPAAAAELQAHDAFQRAALADGGHAHLRSGRLSEVTSGDSWIPRILVTTDSPSGQSTAVLEDLLTSRPRTSVAVVAAAGTDLQLPGTWTLPAQPGATVELPGLDLAVKLQYLDDAAYDRLVQLLVTSSRPDDVAPPLWTQHAGPAGGNGPLGTVDSGGAESALAPETAAVPGTTVGPAYAAPGDLVSALPNFASLSPAITPTTPAMPTDTAQEAEDASSALSPAVAGSPADEVPDAAAEETDAAPAKYGLDLGAAAPADEPEEAHEEASARGNAVWDRPDADDEFNTALSEVLAEQHEHVTQQAPGTDDEESGLSAASLGQPDVRPTAPSERRIVPKPSAATSTVLAALSTPPDPPAAPQVHVLGPVDLVGTLGRVDSNRRNSLMEIAVWLVLHPGLSRQDLDDAIWPGMRIRAETRNTAISKLRAWMGRDPLLPAGDSQAAYLPPITDGIYALSDQVTSDWAQFQDLYQEGMHHEGPEADIALAQALTLVRGRPFADIDPAKYIWAEAHIQEMISAIVDVAHELAERRRHVRDYRAAAQAVTKGLICDAQSELLYRDLFTICYEMGDKDGLERAAHQLARINTEVGCDSSPETVGLLRTLLRGEQSHHTLESAAS